MDIELKKIGKMYVFESGNPKKFLLESKFPIFGSFSPPS